MQKAAYKLVWVNGDGSFVSYTHAADQIGYELGKTSRPHSKCGPLTAFESLIHAKLFLRGLEFPLRHLHRCAFLRCEIELSQTEGGEHAVWKHKLNGELKPVGVDFGALPSGTVLCSSIRPIRREFPLYIPKKEQRGKREEK